MSQSIALVRQMSSLLQRTKFFSSIGQMFGGSRDFYAVFGYNKTVTSEMMYQKYLRQDIAKTIVEAPAKALWTNPPTVMADNAMFMKAWTNLLEKVDVWNTLLRAEKMLGYGRFSIITIGINPNPNAKGADKILWMQPWSELAAEISEREQNQFSPRFQLPKTYKIQPANADLDHSGMKPIKATQSFDVDWSKTIHLADNVTEDNIFGIPNLYGVYNLLDDLMKVSGGSAETYWLTSNRGMHVDLDKEVEMNTADAEALADEIDEYGHQLRRVMRTRGVTIKELGGKVADPSNTFEVIMALIAAATRTPRRILIGSEAGQLASEQDRANWAERVMERRASFAEPHALTPFIQKMIDLEVLPQPKNLKYIWPEAFVLSPLERAQTSAQQARSAANLIKAVGTPDTPASTDALGNVTPMVPGTPQLVTPEEAKQIIGINPDTKQIPGVKTPQPVAIHSRR